MAAKPLLLMMTTDLHLGGVPRLMIDLATGMHQLNEWDLLVVSISPLPKPPANTSVPERIRQAGVEVVSLEAASPRDWRILPRLVSLIRKRRPAIVYSLMIHANILATAAKPFCPPFKLFQCIQTLQPNPRWHWWAQGWIAPFADGFIAPIQAIVDRVNTYGLIHSSIAIPNGIDVVRFQNSPPLPPEQLPAPPGTPLIGYVGRFDPVKNLSKLVDAYALYVQEAQRFNQVIPHLVLVGWGVEEQPLRRQVARLNLRDKVHFPGPSATPEKWFKSFHCFALASDIEGYGIVVAESIAAGTPVLAIESPAMRCIVGNSYPLCKTSEVDSLLSGLRNVMNEGRMWITQYCPAESICDVKKMSQLYNKFFKNF